MTMRRNLTYITRELIEKLVVCFKPEQEFVYRELSWHGNKAKPSNMRAMVSEQVLRRIRKDNAGGSSFNVYSIPKHVHDWVSRKDK